MLPRRIDKPWGHEVLFALTDRYAGKVIFVRAGESLSYQYHRRKEETLYVAAGRLRVRLDFGEGEEERVLAPEDVLHLPPGARHRAEALQDTTIFEVSTPELDDVVRLEDRYGRAAPPQEGTDGDDLE